MKIFPTKGILLLNLIFIICSFAESKVGNRVKKRKFKKNFVQLCYRKAKKSVYMCIVWEINIGFIVGKQKTLTFAVVNMVHKYKKS